MSSPASTFQYPLRDSSFSADPQRPHSSFSALRRSLVDLSRHCAGRQAWGGRSPAPCLPIECWSEFPSLEAESRAAAALDTVAVAETGFVVRLGPGAPLER